KNTGAAPARPLCGGGVHTEFCDRQPVFSECRTAGTADVLRYFHLPGLSAPDGGDGALRLLLPEARRARQPSYDGKQGGGQDAALSSGGSADLLHLRIFPCQF